MLKKKCFTFHFNVNINKREEKKREEKHVDNQR